MRSQALNDRLFERPLPPGEVPASRGDRVTEIPFPQRLPSRLSLVTFDLEGQRYALPVETVERVLPMVALSPLPAAPEVVLGIINLRQRVIPVVDLRRRFGLARKDYGLRARLLVTRTRRRSFALAVDAVADVIEVDATAVRPPETVLPRTRHVAGIVALPDGLLFIHDLDAVLSLDEERRLDDSLTEIRG
jgi:purine-binding chemotaxis protein CheW